MDYFKEYNDNYGHQEGDRCLIAIAGCISEVAGAHGGFCARYGGDEFVVMYENISKEDAKEYVEELRRKVMELTLPHRFQRCCLLSQSHRACIAMYQRKKTECGIFYMWQMRYYTA